MVGNGVGLDSAVEVPRSCTMSIVRPMVMPTVAAKVMARTTSDLGRAFISTILGSVTPSLVAEPHPTKGEIERDVVHRLQPSGDEERQARRHAHREGCEGRPERPDEVSRRVRVTRRCGPL